MGLIQPITQEQAEGEVKEAYDFFESTIGTIPTPIMLYSVSPHIFKEKLHSLNYFRQHPTLSFALLSSIRYLVARAYDFCFCTKFNEDFLKKQGLTGEDIQAMARDPECAPLDDKERAMLAFVIKAVKSSDSITREDMEGLHAAGWSDQETLEAMMHACSIVTGSIMMKTFKMETTC